jgi:hypothetical protein
VLDAITLPQSRRTLVEFTARSEFCVRRGIASSVRRSRCAVGPCPGCAVFPRRTDRDTVKRPGDILSSSLVFLQSLAHRSLSRMAAAVGPSHGLSFPSARAGSGDPLSAGVPKPALFRLQGLVTLLAAYSRPNRVGLISCRQRSWDSPFGAFSSERGADAFPRLRTHLPFLPPGYSRRTRRRAGPGGRGFWGFTLAGVPLRRAGD